MDLRLKGKESDNKDLPPLKAESPMDVRPSGKETEGKEVASLKAESPMDVRPTVRNEIDVKEVAPLKA